MKPRMIYQCELTGKEFDTPEKALRNELAVRAVHSFRPVNETDEVLLMEFISNPTVINTLRQEIGNYDIAVERLGSHG